jgi:hypothetical protein
MTKEKGKKSAKIKKLKKIKRKKKKEYTVDYCCNPQCIWVWVNSKFPTPFSLLLN